MTHKDVLSVRASSAIAALLAVLLLLGSLPWAMAAWAAEGASSESASTGSSGASAASQESSSAAAPDAASGASAASEGSAGASSQAAPSSDGSVDAAPSGESTSSDSTEPEEPAVCIIVARSADDSLGSVSGAQEAQAGDEVALRAYALPGVLFAGWYRQKVAPEAVAEREGAPVDAAEVSESDFVTDEPELVFEASESAAYLAVFEEAPEAAGPLATRDDVVDIVVNLDVSGPGKAYVNGALVHDSEAGLDLSQVVFSARPGKAFLLAGEGDDGLKFVAWTAGDQGTSDDLALRPDESQEVTATFGDDRLVYIDVSCDQGNLFAVEGEGVYRRGETVELNVPALTEREAAWELYDFDGWYKQGSDERVSEWSRLSFKADGDACYEARFTSRAFHVQLGVDGAEMKASEGEGDYELGDTVAVGVSWPEETPCTFAGFRLNGNVSTYLPAGSREPVREGGLAKCQAQFQLDEDLLLGLFEDEGYDSDLAREGVLKVEGVLLGNDQPKREVSIRVEGASQPVEPLGAGAYAQDGPEAVAVKVPDWAGGPFMYWTDETGEVLSFDADWQLPAQERSQWQLAAWYGQTGASGTMQLEGLEAYGLTCFIDGVEAPEGDYTLGAENSSGKAFSHILKASGSGIDVVGWYATTPSGATVRLCEGPEYTFAAKDVDGLAVRPMALRYDNESPLVVSVTYQGTPIGPDQAEVAVSGRDGEGVGEYRNRVYSTARYDFTAQAVNPHLAFEGWYLNGQKVGEEATYSYEANSSWFEMRTLEARFTDAGYDDFARVTVGKGGVGFGRVVVQGVQRRVVTDGGQTFYLFPVETEVAVLSYPASGSVLEGDELELLKGAQPVESLSASAAQATLDKAADYSIQAVFANLNP